MTTPDALGARSAATRSSVGSAADAAAALSQFGDRGQAVLVALAILVAGALLVGPFGDIVADLDYHATVHALRRLPRAAIGWSVAAAAVSFAALIVRDASALRYVGARTSPFAAALAGFCGSALGNVAGLGALTAAAVRYRVYGAVGVKADDIARLLLFVLGGFALGLAVVGASATLLEADAVGAVFGWPATALRVAAAMVLATVAGAFAFEPRGALTIGGLTIAAPGRGAAAIQIGLTAVRLTGAALALWALLPATPIDFLTFAAIFSAATALGAISHVPGGAVVFDLVVLWAFRGRASSDAVAAALIAYRGVYYALPLVLSSALFAAFELASAVRAPRARSADRLTRAAKLLSPTFLAALTFGAGAMLLVSGATPTFGRRLAALSLHVPLWAVESAHFFGSLIGVVLLFVARGLIDRRDGAWRLAVILSAVSLGFSLIKGLAFGEAGFLLLLTMLLLASRQRFDRPTSMLDQPFTFGWFAAVGVIIVAAFGALLLAFDGVDLSARDLWWQFAFDAQAPRALRALVGASALAGACAVGALLRAPKGLARPPAPAEVEAAGRILARQSRAEAALALQRDKSLLFSASGESFLMFGKRGRSWIALFDPVGREAERPELIQRFVALAREHGGRAAFYEVAAESLPLYLDAGLTVLKIGEEALVPLTTFSLVGGAAAHLRYALKRGARDGLRFELVPPDRSAAALKAIKPISDEWLEEHAGEEKGFSVAAFEPRFLQSQWVGLVRRGEEAIAFASVMTTDARRDAAIALMRHRAGASGYAMEFLFVELILALKGAGFETLSLGVAPLSGVRRAPLSSRWHWLGAQIWKHGDRFYNFQGLRTFKNKFNPLWRPRYLAASGTVGPFVALADAAALIARPPAAGKSAR
jgi:phosphatidylglycerol lysyltransferase